LSKKSTTGILSQTYEKHKRQESTNNDKDTEDKGSKGNMLWLVVTDRLQGFYCLLTYLNASRFKHLNASKILQTNTVHQMRLQAPAYKIQTPKYTENQEILF